MKSKDQLSLKDGPVRVYLLGQFDQTFRKSGQNGVIYVCDFVNVIQSLPQGTPRGRVNEHSLFRA